VGQADNILLAVEFFTQIGSVKILTVKDGDTKGSGLWETN
jgi:hypothetical protein